MNCNSFITSPLISGFENLSVYHLIDHVSGNWKKEMLDVFFNAENALKIQHIPLLNAQDDEKLIWKLSPNGL